jgi:hypothetical protein
MNCHAVLMLCFNQLDLTKQAAASVMNQGIRPSFNFLTPIPAAPGVFPAACLVKGRKRSQLRPGRTGLDI